MGVAITPPAEDLVRRVAELDRRVALLERMPSGLGSIGPAFLTGALAVVHDETLPGVGTFSVVLPADDRYSHLAVVARLRSSGAVAVDGAMLRFNGDSSNSYHVQVGFFSGAAAGGGEALATNAGQLPSVPGASSPAGSFGACWAVIPDFRDATAHKTVTAVGGGRETAAAGGTPIRMAVSVYAVAAAAASLSLFTSSGSFAAGSRLTILGV